MAQTPPFSLSGQPLLGSCFLTNERTLFHTVFFRNFIHDREYQAKLYTALFLHHDPTLHG